MERPGLFPNDSLRAPSRSETPERISSGSRGAIPVEGASIDGPPTEVSLLLVILMVAIGLAVATFRKPLE